MRSAFASVAFLFVACGPAAAPLNVPPPTTARPPEVGPTDAGAPAADGAAPYSGHGAASVPHEVLARFAAPPLPDDLSRSIQAMLDVRAPGAGQLSPDGKNMYFTWTVTGVSQVFRIDGPQRFPVQLTGGEDATTIAAVAPDGSYLVLSRDRKGEENPGLYLQDKAGGPLVAIAHKPGVQTAFQHVSDDGRFIYFRSNDVKPGAYVIYRYDRQTAQREAIVTDDGLWNVADARGDGTLLLAKDVGSNMTEYFERDAKSGEIRPLFGQGERETYEAAYGAKPGEVIVSTPRLGEFRRLYSWQSGKLTPITPELPHDVSGFHVDHAKTRVLYTLNEGGYTRLRALDAKTWRELAVPTFAGADHVDPVATTRDGRYTTLSVDSGTAPRQSYVYDWRDKKLVAWHAPSTPEIDTRRFAKATLESYPARDGTPIPMFVRRPEKCAADPCPVIVSFHGGPEGQTLAGFSVYAQLFVDAGFVFAQPNVRGSDGYGKKWLHADDGPKRLDVITDIEDASKYVHAKWASNGIAPKVGVTGGSYGGYSTLIAMTMFAGAYDAGAEAVGMSSLVTFLENTAPYRRALRVSEYGDPQRDREALVKLSPLTYIDRVSAPLLITQGASDPRVPVGEALQVQRALEEKKLPNQLIIFEDEGHGAQKRGNRVLELGHMLRFFREHLISARR